MDVMLIAAVVIIVIYVIVKVMAIVKPFHMNPLKVKRSKTILLANNSISYKQFKLVIQQL